MSFTGCLNWTAPPWILLVPLVFSCYDSNDVNRHKTTFRPDVESKRHYFNLMVPLNLRKIYWFMLCMKWKLCSLLLQFVGIIFNWRFAGVCLFAGFVMNSLNSLTIKIIMMPMWFHVLGQVFICNYYHEGQTIMGWLEFSWYSKKKKKKTTSGHDGGLCFLGFVPLLFLTS